MSQFNRNNDNSGATKRPLEGEEESRRPMDPRRRMDRGVDTPRPATGFTPVRAGPALVAQSLDRAAASGPPKDPRVRPVHFLPAPDWSRKEPVPVPDPRPGPPKDSRQLPAVPGFGGGAVQSPRTQPGPPKDSRQLPAVPVLGGSAAQSPRTQPGPPKDSRQLPAVPGFGGGAAQVSRGSVHVDTPRPANFMPVPRKSVINPDSASAAGGAVAVQHLVHDTIDVRLWGFLADIEGMYPLNPRGDPIRRTYEKSPNDSFCFFRVSNVYREESNHDGPQQVQVRIPAIADAICGVYTEPTSEYLQIPTPEGFCTARIFSRLESGDPTYMVWTPFTTRFYRGHHGKPIVLWTEGVCPSQLAYQRRMVYLSGQWCWVEFKPYEYNLASLSEPVSIPNSKIEDVIAPEHLHRRYVDDQSPTISTQRLVKYLVFQAIQKFISEYQREPSIREHIEVQCIKRYLFENIKVEDTFRFWSPYFNINDNIEAYHQCFCKRAFIPYPHGTTISSVTPVIVKESHRYQSIPTGFITIKKYNPSAPCGQRLQDFWGHEPEYNQYEFDKDYYHYVCFKLDVGIQGDDLSDPELAYYFELQGWYAMSYIPRNGEVNYRFENVFGTQPAYVELGQTICLYNDGVAVSIPFPDNFIGPWNMALLGQITLPLPKREMGNIFLNFSAFNWECDARDLLSPVPDNEFERLLFDRSRGKCFLTRHICFRQQNRYLPAYSMSGEAYARGTFMSLIASEEIYPRSYLEKPRIHPESFKRLAAAFKEIVSPAVFVYLRDHEISRFADWIYLFKKMFGFPYVPAEERNVSDSGGGGDGGGGGGGGGH